MKNFAELLCDSEPKDIAADMFICLHDLLAVAHRQLLDVTPDNARDMACACASLLEIAASVAKRAEDGYDDAARIARCGFWRENQP